MKFGGHTENISGPISVTDISSGLNEGSVVSGPVCAPNTERTGVGDEELFWYIEGRQIPRSRTGDGDLSGWIAVISIDGGKPILALQRVHNKQAKEGNFTCFYVPDRGRNVSVSVSIYFPSE